MTIVLVTDSAVTYRRAFRPVERRVVGGVAAGVADHLAVPVLWVRVGFVVATWVNGVGILAYLLLWRFLPLAAPDDAPGVEFATRAGLRRSDRLTRRELAQAVAIAVVGVGVLALLLFTGGGPSSHLLVPVLVGVVGLALVWRQLDDATWNFWLRQTSGPGHYGRIATGLVLVSLAAVFVVSEGRGWNAALDLLAAVVVALIGLALILGPWISGLWQDLGEERRQRIRSQERADVAAHLHDSVLQTLALLQKNADDPAEVATLARRQERELRDWLYGQDAPAGPTLVAGLRAEAADVETAHRVPIELVAVGDAAMTPHGAALVRAAREAMVNAAKHAGAPRIDVYAEIAQGHAEVFVRDRGVGFDVGAVAEDRHGIKGSMMERMRRHGGRATIRSTPGEGTEVMLAIALGAMAANPNQEG